jgi:hypothetical protein
MIPIHLMGMFAAGALAFWVLGGIVLRVGGWVYLAAGTLGVFFGHGVEPLLFLLLGAAMWLLGHWHYALRHGAFKSPVASYVFCRLAPEWMDPMRAWRS